MQFELVYSDEANETLDRIEAQNDKKLLGSGKVATVL